MRAHLPVRRPGVPGVVAALLRAVVRRLNAVEPDVRGPRAIVGLDENPLQACVVNFEAAADDDVRGVLDADAVPVRIRDVGRPPENEVRPGDTYRGVDAAAACAGGSGELHAREEDILDRRRGL